MPEPIDMSEAYKSMNKPAANAGETNAGDKLMTFFATIGSEAIKFFNKHFVWAVTLSCAMVALNSTGYFAIPSLVVFAPVTMISVPAAFLVGMWLLALVAIVLVYLFLLSLHYLLKFVFNLGRKQKKAQAKQPY